MVSHIENGTTDLAPNVLTVARAPYFDTTKFQFELQRLFGVEPIIVGLTAEFPNPGDYKAIRILGRSLVIVRGADGKVRVLSNSCLHRGAEICESGHGNRKLFTCRYHGWCYGLDGGLRHVRKPAHFGEVPASSKGLVAFPSIEKYGLIWASLDTGGELGLDAWLGAFAPELASLDLGDWTLHAHHAVPGPNWRLAFEGYLEGYHSDVLHSRTVGAQLIPNVAAIDYFGRHQRICFALPHLPEAFGRDAPAAELGAAIVPNHIIFPNFSLAGAWSDQATVCIVYPSLAIGESETHIFTLSRKAPKTRLERALLRQFDGVMLKVTRDEDYPVVRSIQESNKNTSGYFTFGRNEGALQHFHHEVEQYHEG